MQLTVEQLEKQLVQKQLTNCYFLTSSESFLLTEARHALWKVAAQQGFLDRQIWKITSQSHPFEQIKRQNSVSDLFHRSFIELRCEKSLSDVAGNGLYQLIQKLQETPFFQSMIVISCENWPIKLQRSHWFQKLSSISTLVLITHPSLYQLPHWLKKELARVQLLLSQQAIDFLAASVEGNVQAAKQIITKLSLIYGTNKQMIGTQELGLVLNDAAAFELFDLRDAILKKEADRCIRVIQYLEQTHTPPALVLGVLLKMLRVVSQLKDEFEHNADPQLFEKYGVWRSQQAGFKRVVQQLSQKEIAQLFSLAHHIDCCIKGACKDSSWHWMKKLSIYLTGTHTDFIKRLLQY